MPDQPDDDGQQSSPDCWLSISQNNGKAIRPASTAPPKIQRSSADPVGKRAKGWDKDNLDRSSDQDARSARSCRGSFAIWVA